MIISRTQSRALAVAVLVAFVAISLLLIRFSRQSIPGRLALDLPSISIEERTSNVVLGKFHRSEMKHGKKAWEISADKGKYITEKNEIVVSIATLTLYRDDGSSTTLKADEATLALSGADIKSAHAVGNVVVSRDDEVTLTTSDATYDKENNLVIATGPVSIRSETFDTDGEDLTIHLDTEEVLLAKNVHSVIRQKNSKETQ